MKITNTPTSSINNDLGTPAPSSKPAARSSSATSTSGTKVAVSDAASQLAAGSADSDFNAQKVQAISAAIANGTYQVNAGAIADKMLGGISELSGS